MTKEIANDHEVYQKVVLENYVMSKPIGLCTDEYYFIMRECWNQNHVERPSFSKLFQIFSSYFEAIENQSFDLKKYRENKFNLVRKFITIRGKRKKYKIN